MNFKTVNEFHIVRLMKARGAFIRKGGFIRNTVDCNVTMFCKYDPVCTQFVL